MHPPAHWYRPSPAAWYWQIPSALFAYLVRLRRTLYQRGWLRSERLPVPVIIVGNLNVGGTGKTPLVLWLAQQLRAAGYQPGVISRGYGGRARQWPQAVLADSDAALIGDEPLLLAQHLAGPLWVGPDRVAAGRALLAAHPECDVLISDDGLQHYRLQRDLELVVIDGERRFGNQQLLPAGPLREPLSRLHEVDFRICNGGVPQAGEWLMQLQPSALLHAVNHQQAPQALSAWRGRLAHAVAGIGHPERFFQQLRQAGIQVLARPFPDHHRFQASDFAFAAPLPVIMTEKDAVKCRAWAGADVWYLPVTAQLSPELFAAILARLPSHLSRTSEHG